MTTINKNHGSLCGKFLKSLAVAKGDLVNAAAYAAGNRWPRVSDAIKAVVTGMTMGDEGESLAAVRSDFLAVLSVTSVIDRLAGTQVPFNVRGVASTGGIGAAWVKEGDPTPIRLTGFEPGRTLTPKKVAGIAVLTNELARSGAATDATVVAPLASALATAVDTAFLDPANAGDDATPESITFSVGPSASIEEALNSLASSGFASVYAVMNPHAAIKLGFLAGTDGRTAYNTVRVGGGGTLFGIPVLISAASPAGQVTFIDATRVRIAAEDPDLITSGNAAIEMDDFPTAGETNLVSLFQTNATALRAVRAVDWAAHPSGVAFTVMAP